MEIIYSVKTVVLSVLIVCLISFGLGIMHLSKILGYFYYFLGSLGVYFLVWYYYKTENFRLLCKNLSTNNNGCKKNEIPKK